MVISVADLGLFDLAGTRGIQRTLGVACEFSGHLCDLVEEATYIHTD